MKVGDPLRSGLSFRRCGDLSSFLPGTHPTGSQRAPWLCHLERVSPPFSFLTPAGVPAGPVMSLAHPWAPLPVRASLLAARSEPPEEGETPGQAARAPLSWSAVGSGLRPTAEARGECHVFPSQQMKAVLTAGRPPLDSQRSAAFSTAGSPRSEGLQGSLARCLESQSHAALSRVAWEGVRSWGDPRRSWVRRRGGLARSWG